MSGGGNPAGEASISVAAVSGTFPGLARPIAVRQVDARTSIALIIVGSLAFIVLASFATISLHADMIKSSDDLAKLVQAVLGPVVGIVGAVTGFYFGARRGQSVSNGPVR